MAPAHAAPQRRGDPASAVVLSRRDGEVTPHALRRSHITIGPLQGVPLRDMQRAARHTKAHTTVGYDQSERSFDQRPDLRPHGRHRPLTIRYPMAG
jgi:hypothetical protein